MDTLSPLEIPEVLLKLKKDAKLTQHAIGEELGCSQSTVSEMMNGKSGKKRPSSVIVDALRALAKKHGITTASTRPRKPRSARTKQATVISPPPR